MDVSVCDLSAATNDNDFHSFFRWHCAKHDVDLSIIDSIDVSRCRLGPSGTSQLLSFLSSPSTPFVNLKRLCLERNAICSEGGRAVGTFLSLPTQSIELLDISLNDIKAGGGEPTATQVISNALKTNIKLKTIIMDKCALGPEGATHLASSLIDNKSSITRLELAGNMIGPVGGDSRFCALKSNSSLRELGLKMNRIGGGADKSDVQSLSNALSGGVCCLTKLDLSYNDLRCSGCIFLARALMSKQCPLTELILEKNDILTDGCVAVANALCANDTLRKLVLRGNSIGDDGAIALGTMLSYNSVLKTMDLSSCSIGNVAGVALGRGLGQNSSIEHFILDKNSLGVGVNTALFDLGVSLNRTLKRIHLSGNGFDTVGDDDLQLWGRSIAKALSNNLSIRYVDLSNNALSDPSIIDAVATAHSPIEYFDISDNNFEHISIESQLELSKRLTNLEIDMSLNPISSPPLGKLANHSNLQSYLTLLSNEKTAVTRIRLMVLGYGGVGKSTFCRAITNDGCCTNFESSLVPVQEWSIDRVVDWARQLGTPWSTDAVRLVLDERISGRDLTKLIDTCARTDDGTCSASKLLLNSCSRKYPTIDCNKFARAISALRQKGYLSTVGAVKVDGSIKLGDRTCSMVDFAGQVEFLVSHQLLLSSMHTLCMIIQPLPSFGRPDHHHYGSWDYWSKFLSSLGDRRRGSLLLAISQLDKVTQDDSGRIQNILRGDFIRIKKRSHGAISCPSPLMLDYRPDNMMETMSNVKAALSKSLNEVAHSWWVPASYEMLADILQRTSKRKRTNNELPKLTTSELLQEIDEFCAQSADNSMLLSKMKTDRKLLERAMNYLEAVGDVMQANEWILLDPIGWFSSFLAHFIKDDLAVSTVQVDASTLRQQRGIVNLDEIVCALRHDYKSPQEHVFQIMSLLCDLELCVPLESSQPNTASVPHTSTGSVAYLFPCLLPPLGTLSELSNITMATSNPVNAIRGHRFREVSGFIPPGLFVGLLARMYQKLKIGVMHPLRMWRDHALLVFNNSATHVMLKLNLDKAIIDIVGWAPENEQLFVGAAKGQASVVHWMVHVIKMFLRSYTQLKFHESWLCPNPKCHGMVGDDINRVSMPSEYVGSEFLLSPCKLARHDSHDCDVEGCWRFLGTGHSLERMKLHSDCQEMCQSCNCEPVFTLRDKVAE
ncbi:hypothetical protein HJC23_008623 [Cyclotella cryptica]|uniref:Uncharacterized protein n=1 Tax=Cyclotella cryptica TaxID=29204 RepID=A0ABD3NHM4_9STRA